MYIKGTSYIFFWTGDATRLHVSHLAESLSKSLQQCDLSKIYSRGGIVNSASHSKCMKVGVLISGSGTNLNIFVTVVTQSELPLVILIKNNKNHVFCTILNPYLLNTLIKVYYTHDYAYFCMYI